MVSAEIHILFLVSYVFISSDLAPCGFRLALTADLAPRATSGQHPPGTSRLADIPT